MLFVKGLNEDLVHSLEYLKNKIDAQQASNSEYSNYLEEAEDGQVFDAASLDGSDEKATLEYLKMNFSNESKVPQEKEVLNVSEHYSKFNRTMEFGSK